MKRPSHRALGPSRKSWARDEAIKSCLPLVKSLAARLRVRYGLYTPFEDLFAAGVVGLVEAAERFDPDRGVAFTTFAYRRIRGAILDSQRAEGVGGADTWAAEIEFSDLVKKSPANTNALPNPDPGTRRASWAVASKGVVQLASIEDSDGSARAPDEAVDRRRQSDRLREALVALPSSERRVLELYYFEGESFSGIGARLGICKPWAFRLRTRALQRLREVLEIDRDGADDSSGNVSGRALSKGRPVS